MSFWGKSKKNLNIISSILIMAFRSTILWILRTIYLFQKKKMFSSIMLLFWLSCEERLSLIGRMWVQNNLSPVQPHSDSGFKSREPVLPESRKPVLPESRGPVLPESRGPVPPESRGPVPPESRGPVLPEPASASNVVRIFGFYWHLKSHVNFKK